MNSTRSFEFQTVTQFLKFCLIGASGTILSLAVLFCLTEYLAFKYWIASPIGYFLGISNNFFWNRQFTFTKTEKSIYVEYSEYVISMIVGAVGYWISTIILTEFFSIWYFLSAVLSVGISTIIDFTLSKTWVFSRIEQESEN